jgi:hypothetical protein
MTVVIGLAIWAFTRVPDAAPPSSTSASPAVSRTSGGFLPLFPKGQRPPAGLTALIAPLRPPRAVDATRGRAMLISGIPVMLQGKYTVTELGGGFLVTSRPAYSGLGQEPPTDAFVVTGDLGTAKLLGTADSVSAAADGQSVLTATGPVVTRHSLDGARREEVTLPPNRAFAAETQAGFLVSTVPQGAWEIWDPRSGEVRHRFPQLFAASGPKVAYGSFSRAVTVLDLATGEKLETEIPDRELAVHQAVLSRDGRYLATHLINRGQWQHLIAVLDTELSLWYAMPGSPFAALNQLALAWSGRTLVVAYATDQPVIALWTPGEAEVYGAPVT